MLPLDQARANPAQIEWDHYDPPVPVQTGITVHLLDLEELREYIDWTPFFLSWELAGRFPDILEDPIVGHEAKKLYQDALALLNLIIREKWIEARAVTGMFPANSTGDDLLLFDPESTDRELIRLHHLRQQVKKASGQPNLCLSDFVCPLSYRKKDYLGAFAVSAGFGVDALVQKYEAQHDDYHAILVKALADRLAEAGAEYLHEKIRKEIWGYERHENLSKEDLIQEKYSGIRPAPGYPACPDHTEKDLLWKLLQVDQKTGIVLTESKAMYPAASVSGWYFSHPQSKYFGISEISEDQLEDYCKRKGWTLETGRKWLSPLLP